MSRRAKAKTQDLTAYYAAASLGFLTLGLGLALGLLLISP